MKERKLIFCFVCESTTFLAGHFLQRFLVYWQKPSKFEHIFLKMRYLDTATDNYCKLFVVVASVRNEAKYFVKIRKKMSLFLELKTQGWSHGLVTSSYTIVFC